VAKLTTSLPQLGQSARPRAVYDVGMALSDQALDEASLRADPVADAAVVAMFAQGVRGGDLLAAAKERQSSPAIAALLAEADRAPVDPEAMERTRRLVLRYAPPIGLALGLKALPTLYALPEIAEALVATGRLIQHGERRMLETAEYLNQLTCPGGCAGTVWATTRRCGCVCYTPRRG
jgi:hypothetical protein